MEWQISICCGSLDCFKSDGECWETQPAAGEASVSNLTGRHFSAVSSASRGPSPACFFSSFAQIKTWRGDRRVAPNLRRECAVAPPAGCLPRSAADQAFQVVPQPRDCSRTTQLGRPGVSRRQSAAATTKIEPHSCRNIHSPFCNRAGRV